MKRRISLFLTLLVVLFSVFAQTPQKVTARTADYSAYDLIDAVNAVRIANGLPAYTVNSALMISAQSHSQYQASIGTWTHTGAGGTDEHDRAASAGYGSGGSFIADENVAVVSPDTSMDTIIYTFWSDAAHWNNIIASKYRDVGVGVAEAGGLLYFTMDVASTGTGYSVTARPTLTGGTPFPTQPAIAAVLTSTPNPDGSVIHEVGYGQSLWGIAIAYGLKIKDLIDLNGLAPTPMIQVGEKLVILPSFTPTLSPTVTSTPQPATRTPTVTATPRTPTATRTITPTPTATKPQILPHLDDIPGNSRRGIGIGLIVVCAIGLAATLFFSLRKK